jgi:formamidopyrimidine-DNA glycosylase
MTLEMPEAIEVYRFYQFIKQNLTQSPFEIEIISGRFLKKTPEHFDEYIRNKSLILKNIFIKGKTMFFRFEQVSVAIIHGMSGRWSDEQTKHSRVRFGNLFFNDTRSFGKIIIFTSEESFLEEFNRLGPHVLDFPKQEILFERLIKKKNVPIGAVLLDQTVIAGIGNYLRCDILWKCKTHYATPVKNVDLDALFDAIVYCLNYHLHDGTFLVYMQDSDPDGKTVYRTKFRGRTVHSVYEN